jgi:hypothetical protein
MTNYGLEYKIEDVNLATILDNRITAEIYRACLRTHPTVSRGDETPFILFISGQLLKENEVGTGGENCKFALYNNKQRVNH